jgi:hypothetical protein
VATALRTRLNPADASFTVRGERPFKPFETELIRHARYSFAVHPRLFYIGTMWEFELRQLAERGLLWAAATSRTFGPGLQVEPLPAGTGRSYLAVVNQPDWYSQASAYRIFVLDGDAPRIVSPAQVVIPRTMEENARRRIPRSVKEVVARWAWECASFASLVGTSPLEVMKQQGTLR